MAYELPSCECVMGMSPNTAELLKNIYCATLSLVGGGLPDQSGHSGEFLTTDGTNASWVALAGGGDVVASGVLALNAVALGGGGTTIKTTTTGTGVVTAIGINVGSAGAFVVNGGALGTPSSGTLSNATGLPVSTGISGLAANMAAFLATPSSANLLATVTDETGSGLLVFGTAPVFASNITVGTGGGTTGAMLLRGTTSGTVTVTVGAAAGTWTMTLPAVDGVSGQVLTTDGNGVTTWETPASGSSLTATQVGYGSAGNALTGTANFTWTNASEALQVGGGASSTIAIAGGGVILTGAAGVFTIAGDGGGQDENLIFDFNSTADTVVITSGTGVTTLDFGSIGLTTALATVTTVSVTTTFNPAVSDTVSLGDATHQWSDLFLAEGGVINWDGGDATLTQVGNVLTLASADFVAPNITAQTAFLPDANDGAALGTTALSFSDLFLASGALINISNGDWVATHSAGILTVSTGDLRVTTAGTNTASVVTVGGTQTLAAKTLTAPVINASTQTGNQNIAAVPAADHTANGPTTSIFNLGATIALMDLVYLGSASKWLLTDADAAATATGMLGICLDGGGDTDTTTVALSGSFVRDDTWNWTPGATLYIDTATPGQIVASQPSGTDDVIRVVGFAVTADVIYFNPSPDFITHT